MAIFTFKNQVFAFLMVGLFATGFSSCTREEGLGGTSTIEGKLFAEERNGGNVTASYFVPEERVYIIYGDNEFYGDDIRTHYDGTFRFENLFPGNYTIFAYSDCDPGDCDAGVEPIFVEVTISKNRETVNAGQITIQK